MPLENFIAKITAKNAVADSAQEQVRAAEKARKPFVEAFLGEVYPHWQGPLKTLSDVAGVTFAGQRHVHGFPEAVNARAALAKLGRADFSISECILIETSHGIGAEIAYAFSGDPRRTTCVRIPITIVNGNRSCSLEEMVSATGPLEKMAKFCEEDVPAAALLLGELLDRSFDLKVAEDEERAKQAEIERKKQIAAVADHALAEAAEAQRQADAAVATAAEKQAAAEAAKAAT